MIVGVIQGQSKVKDEKFTITEKVYINANTATFTFSGQKGQAIDNLKSWYSDPVMIGRHFLVYSDKAARTKRQYTICSSIAPRVMKQLLSIAKDAL